MLFIYLILTIGYAILIYFYNDSSKMGVVTAICVGISDIIATSLAKGGVLTRPSAYSFFLLLNRFLIILGGRDGWAFGIIILYLMYAIILSH